MKCPQCGADNPEEAVHCNLCFAKFGAETAREGPPQGVPTGPPEAQLSPPPMPPVAAAPSQPLPPGAWMAPPAGPGGPLPPGATVQSPADAFGYGGGYAQPPGPPAGPITPVKKMNSTLMWAIRIVVILVCFAIGWYGMDYVLTRPKTFTSSNGSYSFTYPGKWKKADSSSLSFTGLSGSGLSMDIGLADVNSADPNYVFFMSSAVSPMDWSTTKAGLTKGYSGDISSSLPQGASISPRTLKDVTIDGKPGLSVKFNMTYQGTTYDCDFTAVQSGTSLVMSVMMAKKPKGTLDKFQDILKSIKFKT